MKYAESPRPKELQEKLDALEAQFRTSYANMCKIYEVVEIIKESPLFSDKEGVIHYEMKRLYVSWTWPTLDFDFHNFTIDQVIEKVCSIVHQKFKVDWRMEAFETYIMLKTSIPDPLVYKTGINVIINVFEGKKATCKLVKVKGEPVVYTNYTFKVQCEEELEKAA